VLARGARLALLGIGWASSARWLSREVAEGVLLAIAGGALGLGFAVIAVPWRGRSRAGRISMGETSLRPMARAALPLP